MLLLYLTFLQMHRGTTNFLFEEKDLICTGMVEPKFLRQQGICSLGNNLFLFRLVDYAEPETTS